MINTIFYYNDNTTSTQTNQFVTGFARNDTRATKLINVIIGDIATGISPTAFNRSPITGIAIGSGIKNIDLSIFDMNYSAPVLKNIAVDSNNPFYASQDGVLYDKNINTLIQYPAQKSGFFNIPESVNFIGDYSFYRLNTNLTGIFIPSGVVNISETAFNGLFGNCPSYFQVDQNNIFYSSSEDGILYNKNKTKLIKYPPNTNSIFIVPDSITGIANYSFFQTKLTRIEFYKINEMPIFEPNAFIFPNINLKIYRKKNFTFGWPSSIQGVPVEFIANNQINCSGNDFPILTPGQPGTMLIIFKR